MKQTVGVAIGSNIGRTVPLLRSHARRRGLIVFCSGLMEPPRCPPRRASGLDFGAPAGSSRTRAADGVRPAFGIMQSTGMDRWPAQRLQGR